MTDEHKTHTPQEPLPFRAEYEVGVQQAGDRGNWEHYHPLAKTTAEAKEKALNEAQHDGMADPMVYMCTGPYRPKDPVRIGEAMIEEVFDRDG